MNKWIFVAVLLVAVAASSSAGLLPVLNTVVGVITSTFTVVGGVLKAFFTNPANFVKPVGVNQQGLNQTTTDSLVMVNGLVYLAGQVVSAETLVNTLYMNLQNLKSFDINNPQYFLDNAVIIGTKGAGQTNKVGLMALPTYSLCGLGEQYKLTSCYICNQDCYVAHNLWGGKCGPSPVNPSALTCLCSQNATEAQSRNTVPDSTVTCQVGTQVVGNLVDLVIGAAFRIRSNALQCPRRNADNTPVTIQQGCIDDCVDNHGYTGGVCVQQYANVANPTYSSSKKEVFCVCTSNDPTTGNSTVLSTTGRDTPLVASSSSESGEN